MSFRMREEHWEVLVSFLEQHKELATGRFLGPNGKQKHKNLWNELSLKLNSLGFGQRSSDKWQKSWTDIKYLIKKKGANLKKDQTGTGGGPGLEKPFNTFEERVLNILGPSFLLGVGEAEIGLPDKNTIPGEFIPFRKATETEAPKARPHYQQPHYSTASPMPLEDHTYGFPQAPKKRKMKENTLEESYTETITVLKEINHTVDVRLKDIADEIRGLKDAIISNRFDE